MTHDKVTRTPEGRRKNSWESPIVARAYSHQQKARPYLELIKTTESFIDAAPGEKWLDLGCGSGRLIRSIWEKSQGTLGQIVGIDLSFTALTYARRSLSAFSPIPSGEKIHLIQADFREGVESLFKPDSFHGITAGLAITYTDHWDSRVGKWDNECYLSLLRGLFLILKEGGVFVFSANVPNPDFRRIAWESWREILLTPKAPVHIFASLVMLYHSAWLKSCVKEGRFHYLPPEEVDRSLRSAGFRGIERQLTYADQAWVFRVMK